ncbi:hypothetical protein AAC387_Pa12g1910 [Persea americana]
MNIVVWNMSNDHQHPSSAETPVGRSGTQRSPYLYGWLLGSNILAITLLCIFALSEEAVSELNGACMDPCMPL